MFLSTIQPAESATHIGRRVGRGIGNGLGEAGGCGHKGQESRAGGFHKVGFEGGQIPLQRRLPKRGFGPLAAAANTRVRLSELNLITINEIDVSVLRQAGLVPATASNIRAIASGEISRAVILKGVKTTRGAEATIEATGDKVEE